MKASSATRNGWVIVGAGVPSIAVHAAVGYSTALFLVAIANDMGWSCTVVSASLSMYSLSNGLCVALVGFLIPALGIRRLISLSAMVLAGGLLVVSRIQHPLTLSAAMLLPVAFGSAGIGGLANYAAIQPWFVERRGTALALAATGSSVGVLLMPLLQSLILGLGWRGAYQAMAGIALALASLHLLIQRQPPSGQRVEAESDIMDQPKLGIVPIFRNRDFWLVFLGLGTAAFSGSLIMVHHVAYLTDNGFGTSNVARVLQIVGIASLIGRIGLGWLSDRIGTIRVLALVVADIITAVLSLTLAGGTGGRPFLIMFALTFGVSLDMAAILFTRLTADLFRGQSFGRVMGMAFVGGYIGVTVGPVFAGAVFDAIGNYMGSFAVVGVGLVLSHACSRALRGRAGLRPAF